MTPGVTCRDALDADRERDGDRELLCRGLSAELGIAVDSGGEDETGFCKILYSRRIFSFGDPSRLRFIDAAGSGLDDREADSLDGWLSSSDLSWCLLGGRVGMGETSESERTIRSGACANS